MSQRRSQNSLGGPLALTSHLISPSPVSALLAPWSKCRLGEGLSCARLLAPGVSINTREEKPPSRPSSSGRLSIPEDCKPAPPPPHQRTLGKKANFNATQNLECDLTRNPLPSGGVSAALSSLKLKELRSCFSTQASVFTGGSGVFLPLSTPPWALKLLRVER